MESVHFDAITHGLPIIKLLVRKRKKLGGGGGELLSYFTSAILLFFYAHAWPAIYSWQPKK